MLSVDLIYLGNEKEKYYNEAADEYIKRLSAYCSFKQKNIKDERLSNEPSQNEINSALEKESKKIFEALPDRSYKIAMCVEGKQMSSERLARTIEEASMTHSDICFIIGSSYGLSPKVKAAADLRLSFSELTFPHQLLRVILLEAVYRAFNIIAGTKYHK